MQPVARGSAHSVQLACGVMAAAAQALMLLCTLAPQVGLGPSSRLQPGLLLRCPVHDA